MSGFVLKIDSCGGCDYITGIDVDRESVWMKQGNVCRYIEMADLPQTTRNAMARFNHRIKLLVERKYTSFLKDIEPEVHIPKPYISDRDAA